MANPAKPAELRILQGNPGKRAIPSNDAIAPLEYGYVEPHRPLGPVGKQFWDSIFGAGELWISIKTDTGLVQMICEQLDRREFLREYVAEHPHEWHMFKQLNDIETQIVSNFGKLGFSPDSRSRLGLAEVKAQSKLEELLARKAERG